MALSLQITKPSGAIVNNPLTQAKSTVSVVPGDKVRIVDSATGKTPLNLRAKKIGDALVVDNLPEGQVVEISNFYSACSPTQPCSMIVDPAAAGADATVITQGTQPVALLGNGQSLIYGADPAAATLAPAAAGAGTAASVSPLLVVGGLVGVGAIAAAAGGGGGGGDGPQTPVADTTPPAVPVIASHSQSSTGLTVAGTAEANSRVFVTLGDKVHEVMADANGNWTTTFVNSELPTAGNVALAAYAQDAAGNVGPTTAGQTVAVVPPGGDPADTTAPGAPVITTPTAGTVVNAAAAASGVDVSGTGEAGAWVTVTWGTVTASGPVDAQGNWSVHFASRPADGATTITAIATDAAGNASLASEPVAVTLDTVAPAAATVAVDLGGQVHGTAPADAVRVVVSDGTTSRDATLASDGSFTVPGSTFTAGQILTVTTFDAVGNPGTATLATAPTTVTLAASGAALGGAGSQILVGDTGSDVLIGGDGGSVRNYQFEYWDVRGPAAGNVFSDDPNGVLAVSTGAPIGWTLLATPMTFPGTLQVMGDGPSGGVPDNTIVDGTVFSYGHAGVPPGSTVAQGLYNWSTVASDVTGGGGLSQSVLTHAGQNYDLRMDLTNVVQAGEGTSFVVLWNGAEIGRYDGVSHEWSGTAPTITGDGTTTQTWHFAVTAAPGASTSSTIEIQSYYVSGTAPGWPDTGVARVEQVLLTSAGTDGADLIVGGAGADLLWGQGGDDILYGGTLTAADGAAVHNAFAYTFREDNGNDTIKDFLPGTDKIVLFDLLDTAAPHDTMAAVVEAPVGTFTQPPNTTNHSDTNLTAADLEQGTSANQYLTLSAGANGLVITLHGEGGAARGSVTLENVTYGTGAGEYDSVQDLIDGDFLVLTQDGFSARLIEHPTGTII